MLRTNDVHNYQEMGDKFVVGPSTGCKRVNTACTVKTCFRLVPVLGHGARVLRILLELVFMPGTVPKLVLGHQQKAMFRLVPFPGTGPGPQV